MPAICCVGKLCSCRKVQSKSTHRTRRAPELSIYLDRFVPVRVNFAGVVMIASRNRYRGQWWLAKHPANISAAVAAASAGRARTGADTGAPHWQWGISSARSGTQLHVAPLRVTTDTDSESSIQSIEQDVDLPDYDLPVDQVSDASVSHSPRYVDEFLSTDEGSHATS